MWFEIWFAADGVEIMSKFGNREKNQRGLPRVEDASINQFSSGYAVSAKACADNPEDRVLARDLEPVA